MNWNRRQRALRELRSVHQISFWWRNNVPSWLSRSIRRQNEIGTTDQRQRFSEGIVVISHGLTKERAVPDRDIRLAILRKAQFERDPETHTTRSNEMAKKGTARAGEILRNRYVKDDPERNASVEAERVNAEVARLIYTMRTDAGLTQGQLAKLVGTTQSVISRLEDSDYEGHSLTMLNRIAGALQKKLTLVVTAKKP
jgi:ribosome-binding protein aMBF1 (putative translation factor)